MASRKNSDPALKDLRTLKKDQLIRIIEESQKKTSSPDVDKRNRRSLETEDTRYPKMPSKCIPNSEAETGSIGWLLEQIKTSVTEAVQELKTELRQEYKALFKSLEDDFKREIENVHLEIKTLKMKVDASINNFEKEFLNDMRESEFRKNNIMIFGLKESTDSTSEANDEAQITDLSAELGVPNLKVQRCFRLGRRSSKPRPVKVICENPKQRTDLLRSAFRIPRLPSNLGFKKVFIKQDLTPKEQEANRQLRQELKNRRELGERVYVRNGRIVEAEKVTQQV